MQRLTKSDRKARRDRRNELEARRREQRAHAEAVRGFLVRTAQEWHPFEHLADREPLFRRFGDVHGCYANNQYAVQIYRRPTAWGEVLHLAIRRHDNRPIRSWDHLWRIKNELVGEAVEAVEIYPRADALVDQAPMRHLWALPADQPLPFGLEQAGWGRSRAETAEEMEVADAPA